MLLYSLRSLKTIVFTSRETTLTILMFMIQY
jgi:hypothetical protein